MRFVSRTFLSLSLLSAFLTPTHAAVDVVLLDVPDYQWHAGCFGTADGNLMGFWDTHGFPNMYTGPANGGVAPKLSTGGNNRLIFKMWASDAHINDYWSPGSYDEGGYYEKDYNDPYVLAGRAEHQPDCIGDFIGLNQKKWTDLNGECEGNINGYSFVYWDKTGAKRVNYTPPPDAGRPVIDIPSGLRDWTKWRGYKADTFSQYTSFNPNLPSGGGCTFEDIKAEIDAGYPILVFLQSFNSTSRVIGSMTRANPSIHGMLIYGYCIDNSGNKLLHYRTSWGVSGAVDVDIFHLRPWTQGVWEAGMPVRGVIGYHPYPKITRITRANGNITIEWDGPASVLYNDISRNSWSPHSYAVEKSTALGVKFLQIGTAPSSTRTLTFADTGEDTAYFRVRLIYQSPN